MNITKRLFGQLDNGQDVFCYAMEGEEATVCILDYGCTIQSLIVRDKNGKPVDVVLGYSELAGYVEQDAYIGVTAGRFANRIAKGKFSLNGKDYILNNNDKGKNHLHGGNIGFSKRIWEVSIKDDKLQFSLISKDGDEGYPACVNVVVTFSLVESTLVIEYLATSDGDTIINLTNHSYFNLNGQGNGDILSHKLWLDSSRVVLTDLEAIPTGEILDVEGSCFDFRTAKPVDKDIADDMLAPSKGYDHCFILNSDNFCKLVGDKSGITLKIKTTKPAVQLYCGNFIEEIIGKSTYHKHAGLCLETEYLPDSPNQKGFSNCVLRIGETYNHKTELCFGTEVQ